MQYLLLIYSNEQEELNMSEDESKAMFADLRKIHTRDHRVWPF